MTDHKEYYAVIFTSVHSGEGADEYSVMANRMIELAAKQEGFLGIESARDESGLGITISYWNSEEDIRKWKQNSEHLEAQRLGKEKWYAKFDLRIAKVVREYHFDANAE